MTNRFGWSDTTKRRIRDSFPASRFGFKEAVWDLLLRVGTQTGPGSKPYHCDMGGTDRTEFPAELMELMVDAGNRRRYPARTFLFHEGDPPATVFLVERGMVRVERTLSSGRTILLTLAVPGDLVGELSVVDPAPNSATAQTLVDSRVLAVPADRFHSLMLEHSEIGLVVLARVAARLRGLTEQFVEATSLSASARVATRLLALVQAAEAAPDVDGVIDLRLPISQEELAQWAGLSREGAVRGLSELRTGGVLETGRKRVYIQDLAALEREALRTH